MKKVLALGLLGLMSVAIVGCSSDDDDGLGGVINGARCEERPGADADYLGTVCGEDEGGRYTMYAHNVNGVNTVACVDAEDLPQSNEEFDEEYVNNTISPGFNLSRQGDYIKGDDCASGLVDSTPDDDGNPATEETVERRTYVWEKR